MQLPKTRGQFHKFVIDQKVDFFDFGCSVGGSLDYGKNVFQGRRGLGIDIDESKLDVARQAGHLVVPFDVMQIPDRKMVDFTVMLHVLEHLPGPLLARDFIAKACRVSRQFVAIRQPHFDSDALLMRHGLKLHCSDWHGHPNMMSSLCFFQILRDLRSVGVLREFGLYERLRVRGSDDPRVQALNAPRDLPLYDPAMHPNKPCGILFQQPVFYEIVVVAELASVAPGSLAKKMKVENTIYESYSSP